MALTINCNSMSIENNLSMIVDRNNDEVKIGALVRVLFIEPSLISSFPSNEAKVIKSMVNKTFEVTEFQQGMAFVYQEFNAFDGVSLALDSAEMELVITK